MRRYSVLGIECALIEVRKLVWFLHRIIASRGLPDPLRLTFTANRFGPYDYHLRHLLDRLDGSYLHFEKRLGDAGPFDPIWFEPTRQTRMHKFSCRQRSRVFEAGTAGGSPGCASPGSKTPC